MSDLTPERKAWIDALPYERLLSRWRFEPIGSALFQGETADYIARRMKELREQGADHVGASKAIGWER